jgi:hypothetical protein
VTWLGPELDHKVKGPPRYLPRVGPRVTRAREPQGLFCEGMCHIEAFVIGQLFIPAPTVSSLPVFRVPIHQPCTLLSLQLHTVPLEVGSAGTSPHAEGH